MIATTFRIEKLPRLHFFADADAAILLSMSLALLVLGLASLFSNTNSGADDLTLSADCPPSCSFFIVGASSIFYSAWGIVPSASSAECHSLRNTRCPPSLLLLNRGASSALCSVHPTVCPSTRLLRFCMRVDGRGCCLCALASRTAVCFHVPLEASSALRRVDSAMCSSTLRLRYHKRCS